MQEIILDPYQPNMIGYTVGFMKCPIHKVELICFCPACRGAIRSTRKARASKRNGKLGGRPPKKGNRDAS